MGEVGRSPRLQTSTSEAGTVLSITSSCWDFKLWADRACLEPYLPLLKQVYLPPVSVDLPGAQKSSKACRQQEQPAPGIIGSVLHFPLRFIFMFHNRRISLEDGLPTMSFCQVSGRQYQ